MGQTVFFVGMIEVHVKSLMVHYGLGGTSVLDPLRRAVGGASSILGDTFIWPHIIHVLAHC